MGYIISIKTALFVFPLIALLFTIPFILHQYHKYGSINKLRVLIIYSFILYLITIYFLVILPLPSKESVLNNTNMIRLEPFAFIKDFIRETSLVINDPSTYLKALKESCFYVVVFNIFMTIPFGMYLRYYYKCSLKKVFLFSFLLSLFFEVTQGTGLYFIYPKPYRLFDLDDLFLNTLGGILGYFLIGMIDKHLPTRDKIDEDSREAGKIVSGFRRITLFCLDIFLYLFITLFINMFIQKSYLKYVVFIIYYILIPYFSNDSTIAGKFLNVKITYQNKRLLRTIFRAIFNMVYYFEIIYILNIGVIIIARYLNLSNTILICIYLFLGIFIFMFYLIHIIKVWKNQKIYYDSILKEEFISTIEGKS